MTREEFGNRERLLASQSTCTIQKMNANTNLGDDGLFALWISIRHHSRSVGPSTERHKIIRSGGGDMEQHKLP